MIFIYPLPLNRVCSTTVRVVGRLIRKLQQMVVRNIWQRLSLTCM